MQCIYEANDYIEAHIIKGLLEQQQIEVYVGGFYLQGGVGEIPVSGNASVWVEDSRIDDAMEVIRCFDASVQ